MTTGAVSSSFVPARAAKIARTLVTVPPVPTAKAGVGSEKVKPEAATLARVWRGMSEAAGGERGGGIRDEFFREADTAELKADGLGNVAIAKREAFEAATAEIEDVEIAERGQCRIARETAANEIGLFVAGEDTDRVASGSVDAGDEVGPVVGVADGTGCDEHAVGRSKGGGVGEQCVDGLGPAAHTVFAQPRRSARNARADTRVDCAVRQGGNVAVGRARGDEEFDRVGPDIDDGD